MRLFLLILTTISAIGCTPKLTQNNLKNSHSPYLLRMQKSPVWWQEWNEQTLKYAKDSKKLIFLSIGFNACHWCHRMEKEVFNNEDFATAANKNFVAIKVDRETQPQVDAHFMKSLQTITATIGWPITLILTPDLLPIFGATFVPADKMTYVLDELQKAWREKPAELVERGKKVSAFANQTLPSNLSYEKSRDIFKNYLNFSKAVFDPVFGGKRGSIKYPVCFDLRVLLRIALNMREPFAEQLVHTTLTNMLNGGIFDQLGGGIHRFANDQQWQIPHFEKMLYDQAHLIQILVDAQQRKPRPIQMKALVATMEFLLNEMQNKDGGFYSSIDSELKDINGGYYTWREDEVKDVLNDSEYKDFIEVHSLTQPNKDLDSRRVIIHKVVNDTTQSDVAVKKLSLARKQRGNPVVDQKIITSWNGLVLSALARLGRFWPSPAMDDILKKNADYVLSQNSNWRGFLYHYSLNKVAYGDAVLDDYALLIDALIEVYQTTFQESYLQKAHELQVKQDAQFLDKESGTYFFMADNRTGLDRFKVFTDTFELSAQAISYQNLVRLAHYFQKNSFRAQAEKLLKNYPDALADKPQYFTQALLSLDHALNKGKEVIVVGNTSQCKKAINELSQAFFPYLLYACKSAGSTLPLLENKKPIDSVRPTFYICQQGQCLTPTQNFSEAKKLILDLAS